MDSVNQIATLPQSLDVAETFRYTVKHIPLKRIFDIVFSALVLILLLPILLLIGIAIKLSSKGKIVYAQERIGRGGKSFRCFKFRTMYADADVRLKELLSQDPEKNREWYEHYKIKEDPRITRFGKILRKTSLDELPQFWNVLKGDLSVVGPRPVIHDEIVRHYGIKAVKILSVRPGVTGLWQVSGRNDVSYETRIKLDETYVESHSFFLDLKLILKTIPSVISSKGAY